MQAFLIEQIIRNVEITPKHVPESKKPPIKFEY